MTREQLEKYILTKYNVKFDYPFSEDFETAVLRHKENKKWFGILMKVKENRLRTLDGEQEIWVLNTKCEPMLIGGMIDYIGVFPAYHMNKNYWVSIYLEKVDIEKLYLLLDISFNLTMGKKK